MMGKIALRNVFRQKRRSLLTVLTMFTGFVLSAFTIAWSDGSYSDVIEMFTNTRLGQIQIHEKSYTETPSLYKYIENPTEIGEKLSKIKGIKSYTIRLKAGGLGSISDKTAAIDMTGIYPGLEDTTTGFNSRIKKGKPLSVNANHEVVIGKGLAKILNADVGKQLVVVSQGADGSIANDLYNIVGIYDSNEKLSDRVSVFLHIKDMEELMVLENKAHEIAITIDKIKDSKKLSKIIANTLEDDGLLVEPWQEFAASFYKAMKADRKGMWIMLFIIVLIVAIGVFNTVLMAVLERQREYGVLLALGTKPKDLIIMILSEVTWLAVFSIVGGIVIAFILNYYISIHGIAMSEPISYGGMEFSFMRTEINFSSYLIPGITVLITAIVVAFLPALKAAKTDPAKTMRKN